MGSVKDKIVEARQNRLRQMPKSLRANYKKSAKSKAAAIKSMCAECCGFDRAEVRECTGYGCPLWPHRPYQKDDEDV